MHHFTSSLYIAAAAKCILSSVVKPQLRTVPVATNPAATGSISFAPTHPGFQCGLFDVLDIGSAAAPGIVSVPAGGVAQRCNPEFVTAPSAVRGSATSPLLPGAKESQDTLRRHARIHECTVRDVTCANLLLCVRVV
jgi:hypothetical protein